MPLTVDIMTPDRLLLQTEADAVIVPAFDGELGILQNHVPLLTELQPGQIRLRRGSETELFAVSGGFLEVRSNRVSVFAEAAEMANEIDVERARQAAEKARTALRSRGASETLDQAETALRRALVRLRVSEISRQYGKPAQRSEATR